MRFSIERQVVRCDRCFRQSEPAPERYPRPEGWTTPYVSLFLGTEALYTDTGDVRVTTVDICPECSKILQISP